VKTYNKTKIGLIIGMCSVLASCSRAASSSVDQSKIQTTYTLKYTAKDNLLAYSAIFMTAGTIDNFYDTYIELDSSSSITVNDVALTKNGIVPEITGITLYGGSKSSPTSSEMTATYTFVYKNNAGTTYTNAAQLPLAVSMGTPPSSLTRTSTYTVTWTAPSDSVAATESVYAVIAQSTNSFEKSAVLPSTESSTSGSIIYATTDYGTGSTALAAGTATVKICRQKSVTGTSLQAPAAGGTLKQINCTNETSITVN